MPTHQFIKDLEPSQFVEGVYCLQNPQKGMTRSGNPYLKAIISDRTGRVACRFWNLTDALFAAISNAPFVRVEGQTQPYQGEVQFIAQRIEAAQPDAEHIRNLLPTSARDPQEMFAELVALLDTLEHPAIRALIRVYLEDERLMARFQRAPAAMMMHHAYLGGLLEHTLQLCNLADRMLPLYPKLNRDLVLTGLFLHDLSKVDELSYDSAFSYTDPGLLLGHLVMGSLLLQRKAEQAAAQGPALPRDALMTLHHIIISHHGQPEFGAARIPSTPEAVFISRLDELDAKAQMAIDHARPESEPDGDLGGNFTEKVWALDTRLFRPDPLRASNAPASSAD